MANTRAVARGCQEKAFLARRGQPEYGAGPEQAQDHCCQDACPTCSSIPLIIDELRRHLQRGTDAAPLVRLV